MLLISLIAGCNLITSDNYEGIPLDGNPLDFLLIHYLSGADPINGRDARGMVLNINNTSQSTLENVKIRINKNYSSRLSDIIYCNKSICKEFGTDSFPANTKLSFLFSHDVSNHGKFRNPTGQYFPKEDIINTLEFECNFDKGQWKFIGPL